MYQWKNILLCLFFVFSNSIFANDKPIKIGIVTFLSGPAAGPFGVPAKIAADVIVESLNAGKVPHPYNSTGFSGRKIELVYVDEAGGASKQVTEFRNLVSRQKVDFVIGYISSGDCLAIPPVADELKTLTVLMDCGTPRVFEENDYEYVFRTRAHSTMDAVAGVRYILELKPETKSYSGINQNYAFGHDSWSDWTAVMKVLSPNAKIDTSQMPKFGAGQYGAEISALMRKKSAYIHSSMWGGDLEAFMFQAKPRGLFKNSPIVLVAGEPYLERLTGTIPDGTIIGARGTSGVFAPESELNNWLRTIYFEKEKSYPTYPAYSMAKAILGLKSAYEKARLKKVQEAIPMADRKGVKEEMEKAYSAPNTEEIVKSFEYQSFDSPSGKIHMKLGKGHQAVHGTAYGMTSTVGGKIKIINVKKYKLEDIQPPVGIKSVDWIKSGLKPGKW